MFCEKRNNVTMGYKAVNAPGVDGTFETVFDPCQDDCRILFGYSVAENKVDSGLQKEMH